MKTTAVVIDIRKLIIKGSTRIFSFLIKLIIKIIGPTNIPEKAINENTSSIVFESLASMTISLVVLYVKIIIIPQINKSELINNPIILSFLPIFASQKNYT